MADRKAELEAKRERLRQMREEKERRRKEKERQDAENAARSLRGETPSGLSSGPASDATGSSLGGVTSEIDRVLADYGIAPVKAVNILLNTFFPPLPFISFLTGFGIGFFASTATIIAGQFFVRRCRYWSKV